MNSRAIRWAAALAASVALHAGAALWFGPQKETIAVAGGARAEITVLGNAFEDAAASGTQSQSVEPVNAAPEAVRPVETETVTEPVADAAARPVPTKNVETPREQAAVDQIKHKPVQQTRVEATEPKRVLEIVEDTEADPLEPVPEGAAIAALQPRETTAETQSALAPRGSAAAEPLDEPDLPAFPETAPRPTPRPEKVAKVSAQPPPRKIRPREEPEETASKPRQRTGAGGNASRNTRQGSADGSKLARKTSAGDTGRSREAGNAAVSNYPGKVYAKLRRSLRYPSEAKRKRIRGEVHVSFTVSRSGGVGGVRLARSSGSPVLDNAALETVRRAAPFPEIPRDAGRTSWSFTVPLQFTR